MFGPFYHTTTNAKNFNSLNSPLPAYVARTKFSIVFDISIWAPFSSGDLLKCLVKKLYALVSYSTREGK